MLPANIVFSSGLYGSWPHSNLICSTVQLLARYNPNTGNRNPHLTCRAKGGTLCFWMTHNQSQSRLAQLDDAVSHDAHAPAFGIRSNGRYAQAPMLLVCIDEEPVVAVADREVDLGLEALDRLDSTVRERL